jgi:phosphoribosyl 1,2-cyclic phosphate phosphodiesterase
MPVYAAPETMENLSRVFFYAFSGQARFPGYIQPEPHLISGPFYLGENEIIPVELEHGRAHVLGFLIREERRSVLAYVSDCKAVSPDGMEVLRGVDTLILGTPSYHSHPTHLSLSEGIALAGSLGARQTFLTHLSHDLGHVQTQKKLPTKVFLAYDGLRLVLGRKP